MWEWYEWESKESFEIWHQQIKTILNYPLVGSNQATGEPDLTACLTTEYTEVIEIDGYFIGMVESENAAGLIKTNKRKIVPIPR